MAFSSTPAAGSLIVGCMSTNDYADADPSPDKWPGLGAIQSAEMEQKTFCGGYLWWGRANGVSNSFPYTINSTEQSAWMIAEFTGNEQNATLFDASQGKFAQTSGNSLISDSIVPSVGQRLLVACMPMSISSSAAAITGSWDSSFTLIDSIGHNVSATRNWISMAYRVVTGDGSTGFTTTCTHSGAASDARASCVAAFREASAAYSPPSWPRRTWRFQ